MSSPSDPSAQAEAAHILALLTAQADGLRADLLRLRQELTDVQREASSDRGMQLLEANQKLVLAALNATKIAETATHNLNEITRSSQYDALTHTINRTQMFKQIAIAIAKARANQGCLALLFLDIDHFRHINTTLGHAGGDEALKLVSRRLELVVQDSGTISRHGGDEFLILLTSISKTSDATLMAAQILSAIAAPSTIDNVMLNLSASIGIAIYPDDGDDVIALTDRADTAMFYTKRKAPGGFCLYESIGNPNAAPVRSLQLPSRATMKSRITDLREANEQLVIAVLNAQELEAHAREAHRQQIKFMAMVAHELRNPLTPIRVAASLLSDRRPSDEPSLERLQVIIDGQVMHMSRLIGDLLDGSRISTGKLRLELSAVEMIGILDNAIETCKPGMELRKQQIQLHLPVAPVVFHGDAVRLVQIFSNLLDNASKYTPPDGEIGLEMNVLDHAMTITVSDNGIGISAEVLPHIFDMFVQDARALTHASGGLGIGLAVVRDLVEAHGGTVTARSGGRHQGSEFIVTLPLCDNVQHRTSA